MLVNDRSVDSNNRQCSSQLARLLKATISAESLFQGVQLQASRKNAVSMTQQQSTTSLRLLYFSAQDLSAISDKIDKLPVACLLLCWPAHVLMHANLPLRRCKMTPMFTLAGTCSIKIEASKRRRTGVPIQGYVFCRFMQLTAAPSIVHVFF